MHIYTYRSKYFINEKYNTFDFWSTLPICAISSSNCSYCLSNENTFAHSRSFLLSFDVQNHGGFRATKNISFWILAGPNPLLALQQAIVKTCLFQGQEAPSWDFSWWFFHKSIAFTSSPKRWVLRKIGPKGWSKQPWNSAYLVGSARRLVEISFWLSRWWWLNSPTNPFEKICACRQIGSWNPIGVKNKTTFEGPPPSLFRTF